MRITYSLLSTSSTSSYSGISYKAIQPSSLPRSRNSTTASRRHLQRVQSQTSIVVGFSTLETFRLGNGVKVYWNVGVPGRYIMGQVTPLDEIGIPPPVNYFSQRLNLLSCNHEILTSSLFQSYSIASPTWVFEYRRILNVLNTLGGLR
jgi:hypothetical protein